jgi:hypothetical protein
VTPFGQDWRKNNRFLETSLHSWLYILSLLPLILCTSLSHKFTASLSLSLSLSLCLSHDDFPGLLVHKIKCDVAYQKRVTCFAGWPAGWLHVVCNVFEIYIYIYRSACNRHSFSSLDLRHRCFTKIGIKQVSYMVVFSSFVKNLLSASSGWLNLIQVERVERYIASPLTFILSERLFGHYCGDLSVKQTHAFGLLYPWKLHRYSLLKRR